MQCERERCAQRLGLGWAASYAPVGQNGVARGGVAVVGMQNVGMTRDERHMAGDPETHHRRKWCGTDCAKKARGKWKRARGVPAAARLPSNQRSHPGTFQGAGSSVIAPQEAW